MGPLDIAASPYMGPQYSHPDYPFRRGGRVLVCGSAWTLADDLKRARRDFGELPVIAVNNAARLVKAFAVYSAHADRLKSFGWIDTGRTDIEIHSSARNEAQMLRRMKKSPYVHYWWLGVNTVSGTGGWAAAKIGILMGFEEIILCGCPVEKGGYMNAKPAQAFQKPGIVKRYQEAIRGDVEWHPFIHSMSGWTKELLGAPC